MQFTLRSLLGVMTAVALAASVVARPWPEWYQPTAIGAALALVAAMQWRQPRVFFRVMLPISWLGIIYVSWRHPGDEYGIFALAAVPGWLALFLPFTHVREILPLLFGSGMIGLAIAGWGMDRLRVWRTAWICLWWSVAAALVWSALREYPSYERAMAKNGSLTAYVVGGLAVGLYVSALFFLVFTALVRWGIRIREAHFFRGRWAASPAGAADPESARPRVQGP